MQAKSVTGFMNYIRREVERGMITEAEASHQITGAAMFAIWANESGAVETLQLEARAYRRRDELKRQFQATA